MKPAISNSLLCELNILRNRLEAGESIIQCLSQMGAPLEAPEALRQKWKRLTQLMIEGRVLPAKAIADLTTQLESEKKLYDLVQQKTLSPRIQAGLSFAILLLLLASAAFVFPPELRPTCSLLLVALTMCVLSAIAMHFILRRLQKRLTYLEWISFQRNLCLALQCGISFRVALVENLPPASVLRQWPQSLVARLRDLDHPAPPARSTREPLWTLSHRVWETLVRNYNHGLPLNEMLQRLAQVQEDVFKNWIQTEAEKLSYLLLLPLFLLSVPAVLLLLFAPLLNALHF